MCPQSHSEVPEIDEDWPSLDSILLFRDRVRSRLIALYDDLESGKRNLTRNIARTLVMTHEHEGFHVEVWWYLLKCDSQLIANSQTLLYMLIQRAGTGTLPPPGFVTPPWADLAEQWDTIPSPSTKTVSIGPATLILGHDDSEGDDALPEFELKVQGHTFGWDNESPARTVTVDAVQISWRPITNGEFEAFYNGPGKGTVAFPKSWLMEDSQIKVSHIALLSDLLTKVR